MNSSNYSYSLPNHGYQPLGHLARHGWGEFHRWDLLVDQVARLAGAPEPLFRWSKNHGGSDGSDGSSRSLNDGSFRVWDLCHVFMFWIMRCHNPVIHVFVFLQHMFVTSTGSMNLSFQDEAHFFFATTFATEDAELHRGGVSSDGDPGRSRRAGALGIQRRNPTRLGCRDRLGQHWRM